MLQFLQLGSRIELKSLALDNVLGLTATEEGMALLANVKGIFTLLATIAEEDKSEPLRKNAALALINLSADKSTALKMTTEKQPTLVTKLWKIITKEIHPVVDPACMILSNLTIDEVCCANVYDSLSKNQVTLDIITDMLCRVNSDPQGAKLHYLGPLISNLSQLSEVRHQLLLNNGQLVKKLLPFTEYKESSLRRGGVIGAIRNCCFDTNCHDLLLNQLDLLPRLTLPLAGPTPDCFEEDEIEKLPIDLQYLDQDKDIEHDADIRKLLLEALCQLCATRKGRERIREQNVYLILRELHKVEKDENVKLACENVVDILIKKEEEIKLDNYREVNVPDDIK